MQLTLGTLAIAASLLSSTNGFVHALSPQDIPGDTPVSSLLSSAQSHLSRGETSEALLYYDAAIARDASNYLTFFKRATTYLSLGRTKQATEDFSKVLALKPGFEGAHVQLGKLKARSADWDGAREEYKLAKKGSSSPEMAELDEAHGAAKLAHAAVDKKDWDGCVSNLGPAIALASRSAPLRELRARCRLEKGDLDEAISDLQHVLHLRPGDTKPYIQISAIAFYCLGNLEPGMGQIRKCLQSDPDSKLCRKVLRQQKAVAKSLTMASQFLEKGKPMTGVRLLIDSGEESGLISDISAQTEELRQEGYIPPTAPSMLHIRVVDMACEAYFEAKSNKADTYCKQALELDGDSFYGLLWDGKAKLARDEFEAAIQNFNKAAELQPDKREKVQGLMQKAQVALKRSKSKDYYKVLNVPHDADERQIKSAWRKLSKEFHPDKAISKGISKEEAEKKMASINEAYEVLSNEELRARFDRGDDPNDPQGQSHPFQGSPFGGFGGFGGHPFFQGGGGGQQFQFKFTQNGF